MVFYQNNRKVTNTEDNEPCGRERSVRGRVIKPEALEKVGFRLQSPSEKRTKKKNKKKIGHFIQGVRKVEKPNEIS